MHAGRHYTLREVILWTRRETFVFFAFAALPVAMDALGVKLPSLPWPPIAVLGIAVAFVTGFKSNAAYGRLWEARQIWGAIVNASRTWAVLVRDFVALPAEDATQRRLRDRHLAWLTALRHQLREPRGWETTSFRHNVEYQRRTFTIPEHATALEQELAAFLAPEELAEVTARKNRASALLALQSAELRRCCSEGSLTELRQIELTRLLSILYEQQGKCERIKNFPYPRQFATLNVFFVWVFIALLPFGMFAEFKSLDDGWVWLTVPVTVLVAWVFHTMDKIGEASENPFEGGPNDVPITAMSRAIEIDLRDLAGESQLPEPCKPIHNILM